MTTSNRKENEMANQPKADYTKVCVICRRDITVCKVPGLHGMTRDRTAKAMAELAAR